MKLSKETVERLLMCEVKVVLPKLALKKPLPNGLFEQKKSKSKHERISDYSDKENENSRNIILSSRRNQSSMQMKKDFDEDFRDKHSKRLKLVKNDPQNLSIGLNEPTKYSKVDLMKLKSSVGNTIRVGSQSLFINASQAKKTKDKCSRKDSGIDVESPVLNTDSSNEIRGFIQSYSSHRCTDVIDREINNVETSRTPDRFFMRKDFVIRIQQCSFNQRSAGSSSKFTTSVVATATECENIQETAKKICRNDVFEKKIGINRHVKVGDEEKNCTRIVQSEFVQTTKQCHKKIKLIEPSRMVTRRKAASNSINKFYKLTNEKLGYVVILDAPRTRSNQRSQVEKSGAESKKKFSSYKQIVSKKKKYAEIRRQKNNYVEPTSSCNQSYYSSSRATVEFSDELNTNEWNSKQKTSVSKIYKDVTIHREENPEQSTNQFPQMTCSSDKNILKRLKTKVKKVDYSDQKINKSIENSELRKSSRIKKLQLELSYETSDENEDFLSSESPKRARVKQFNASSRAKKVVPIQKVKKQKKQNYPKFFKSSKVKKDERPKKSDLPAKRLMKKSEALKKTERFNEQKNNLKNCGINTLPKVVSSAKSSLPRFSLKTKNNIFEASKSETEVYREAACVTFSSKTPEIIPRRKNKQQSSSNFSDRNPYVLLEKLDVSDISTYAITPLREDRRPIPSKSYEDYGIDDVNTDDSTDEEDYPKKIVPQWVKSLDHNSEVQFHFPRDIVRKWIRPPTTKFTVKSLFF